LLIASPVRAPLAVLSPPRHACLLLFFLIMFHDHQSLLLDGFAMTAFAFRVFCTALLRLLLRLFFERFLLLSGLLNF
jgi:hypothetical protein